MQRIAPDSPSQNSFPEQREEDFYGRMASMVSLISYISPQLSAALQIFANTRVYLDLKLSFSSPLSFPFIINNEELVEQNKTEELD